MKNPNMPRDNTNAPIPVLTPKAKHELSVGAGASVSTTALSNRVVRISSDAIVRYKFGITGESASAVDYKWTTGDLHAIAVPEGTTHLHFYGEEAANIYVEELG